MALTAYSIERAGTTYHYSTARSQRDCFTTYHCGEINPLHPTPAHRCRATSEPLYCRISLTASILSPPPPESARRAPSRRLYRGGPSFLSDDSQADATSVRPDGRVFTRLCRAWLRIDPFETVDFCNSLPLSYPHTRRASVQAERVPRDLYKRCFFPIYNRSKAYQLINNEYSS